MTESKNPVTEVSDDTIEVVNYELAFHVLPTVAEGEVADVFAAVKEIISSTGATLLTEEAAERFELAYPIIKRTEGKNRTFKSAYFGWVRFTAPASVVGEMLTEVEAHADVLRALLTKLTRSEIEFPFYFHDALDSKKVETIDEVVPAPKVVPAEKEAAVEESPAPAAEEEATEEVAAEVKTEEASDEEKTV